MSVAWTHVMAFEDVRDMVLAARDRMPVSVWRLEAAARARLLDSDRRLTQLRYALTILRPVDGMVRDDGFLADLRSADATTVRDLIYARYLATVPIAVMTARAILQPTVQRAERMIPRGVIAAMLVEQLAALSPATRARTSSAIVTEFARAGVLRAQPGAAAALELTGRIPSELALLHLLKDDLRERREATDSWLATSSLAAALFAVPAASMRERIESLVAAGRLQRSYFAGEPRILAA